MQPCEFWVLTYAEFSEMVKGYNRIQRDKMNDSICQAWHTAYLYRVNKMPSLESLLLKNEPKKEQTSDEMLATVKMLNAAFGGKTEEA